MSSEQEFTGLPIVQPASQAMGGWVLASPSGRFLAALSMVLLLAIGWVGLDAAGHRFGGHESGGVSGTSLVQLGGFSCSRCKGRFFEDVNNCPHCGVSFVGGSPVMTESKGQALMAIFGVIVVALLGVVVGGGFIMASQQTKGKGKGKARARSPQASPGQRPTYSGATAQQSGGMYQGEEKKRWGYAQLPKSISGATESDQVQLGYAQATVHGQPPQGQYPQGQYPQGQSAGYPQARPPQTGAYSPAVNTNGPYSSRPLGPPQGYPGTQTGYPQGQVPGGYVPGQPVHGIPSGYGQTGYGQTGYGQTGYGQAGYGQGQPPQAQYPQGQYPQGQPPYGGNNRPQPPGPGPGPRPGR